MTRMEFPNKTGNYNVDGIDVYVFPDKIIIDTGNRSKRQRYEDDESSGSGSGKKNKNGSGGGNGKGEKKGDFFNDLLDNAQEFVSPGSLKKKGNR